MAQRPHTFAGRTAGSSVGTEEFPGGAFGDAASRIYRLLKDFGVGSSATALGAHFGANAAGTPTGLSATVNDSTPAPATTGWTVASRIMLTDVVAPAGASDVEVFMPRTAAGKCGSVIFTRTGGFRGRTGGGTNPAEAFVDTTIATVSPDIAMTLTFGVATGGTATTGNWYCQLAEQASGTVLYNKTLTGTAGIGTGNVISANLGWGNAVAGAMLMWDTVFENAYNPSLVPISPAFTGSLQQYTRSTLDFSNFGPGQVTVSVTLDPASAPVTLVTNGLFVYWVETARNSPVIANWTVTDSLSRTISGTATVPPLNTGSGDLIWDPALQDFV